MCGPILSYQLLNNSFKWSRQKCWVTFLRSDKWQSHQSHLYRFRVLVYFKTWSPSLWDTLFLLEESRTKVSWSSLFLFNYFTSSLHLVILSLENFYRLWLLSIKREKQLFWRVLWEIPWRKKEENYGDLWTFNVFMGWYKMVERQWF